MPPKIGILAGAGELPAHLARACIASGRDVQVIGFEGESDPASLAGLPHAWSALGTVGRTFELLRGAACEEVVLVGKLHRPALASLKTDLRGARLLAKVVAAGQGDNRVLALIIRELENEGFRVVGAEEVIAELLAGEGALGAHAPDAAARGAIALGVRVARALGAYDVGQAVVVFGDVVLGVEGQEGTDALIERCGRLRVEPKGGVLVKVAKPGQERRTDLPTIGVATVENAAGAGLDGIAVEAGGALIVDREAVARAADRHGLFVVGVQVGDA